MTTTDLPTLQFDDLCDWFRTARQTSGYSLRLYALVDGVLDESVLPQIIQREILWSSLYPETMLESSTPAAGPYLIDLTAGEREHAAAMRLLLRRGQDKDLVLWVASRQRLRQLVEHCHSYAKVVLPDRSQALLRYYDPSIMNNLVRAFSDEQREHFLSAVYECRYWQGGWGGIAGKDHETLPPVLDQPIALTDEQYELLSNDGFAESLYYQLKQELRPPIAGVDSRQCIDHIRQLLARATGHYKLTNRDDLAYFALLGLNVNLTFDVHPEIVGRLLADAGAHDTLSLRLSHVGDAVWKQLIQERAPLSTQRVLSRATPKDHSISNTHD